MGRMYRGETTSISAAGFAATGYLLSSTAYASTAVPIDRKSAIERFCLLRSIAPMRFGIEIAAIMPMTTSVINSSISVNPLESCLVMAFVSLVIVRAKMYERVGMRGKQMLRIDFVLDGSRAST